MSASRKVAIGAAIVALLVVAYGAAMYWLAPRILHDRLVQQAQAAGIELAWSRAKINPFTLAIALEDVKLRAPKANLEAAAPSADVKVGWATLWKRALVIDSLSVPAGSVAWTGAGQGAGLRLQPLKLDVHGVSTVPESQGSYETHATMVGGGTISSQGRLSLSPLTLQGEAQVSQAPLAQLWALAAAGRSPVRGTLEASSRISFGQEGFALQDATAKATGVVYEDQGRRIELAEAQLSVPNARLPLDKPLELSATALLKPGGRIAASGSVTPQPLKANLKLEASNVALAAAQPFLADFVEVRVASGALSSSGRLKIEPQQGQGLRGSYVGTLAVQDLRLEQPGSGELLLGWRQLETGEASLAFSPFSATLGEVTAREPQGRLVIEPDGGTNFSGLVRKREGGGQAGPIAIRRLSVEGGTLHFADRSLESPFAADIERLAGSVSGFSTAAGNAPAQVALAGRVGQYGEARIGGKIDLGSPKSLTDVRAAFRNLDLVAFSPYAVKFAGYRVKAGRLDANLRYRVSEARLVGDNRITLNQLQLGEKVASKGVLDVPLELAIALLTDSSGRVNVAIPVYGNLDDPKFDFGGLVARAIGNAIGKLVSAPFRALGAAFAGRGGGTQGQVSFAPGSVAIAPSQQENIERIAQALGRRPRLALVVRGGFDPQSDPQAVRRRGLRLELERRAGYEQREQSSRGGGSAPHAIDLRDPKIVRAAEAAFLERGGSRLELSQLPREGYAEKLFDRLLAMTSVAPDLAKTLAEARAEIVRAALVERGVAPGRIELGSPAEARAEAAGVPTELALRVAG